MKKLLRIWWAQIRYSVTRDMMFKGNFLIGIVVDAVWFSMHLAFFTLLYTQVKIIAGWTYWEMILLASTSTLIQQIFVLFLKENLQQIPELVRTGRLDFLLAQPASAQFLLSTRRFRTDGFITAVFAGSVCWYAARHIPGALNWPNFLGFCFFIGFGVLVFYALLLLLMTLSFWIVDTRHFGSVHYHVASLSRLPNNTVTGWFRALFTWLIPMLLVANVPAKTLARGWQSPEAWIFLGIGTLFFLASRWFFRFGLSRYTSASS